jgi:hypothetical protein
LQDTAQKLLVETFCYAIRWQDTSMLEKLLNTSVNVKFLKTEGMAYWVKHVGGFTYKFDKDTNMFTKVAFNHDKDFTSDLKVVFSFDKFHVAAAKSHKFYEIAPMEFKELVINTDFDKLFNPLADKLARGLLSEELNHDDVLAELAKMTKRVEEAMQAKKNKEWVADYIKQQSAKLQKMEANLPKDELVKAPELNEMAELLQAA